MRELWVPGAFLKCCHIQTRQEAFYCLQLRTLTNTDGTPGIQMLLHSVPRAAPTSSGTLGDGDRSVSGTGGIAQSVPCLMDIHSNSQTM